MGWRKFIITLIAIASIISIAWATRQSDPAVWAIVAVSIGFTGGNAIEHWTQRK